MKKFMLLTGITCLLFSSCQNDNDDDDTAEENVRLILKFVFDEDQERLDSFGNPDDVPAGHAAQDPDFNSISAHYVEMIPSAMTALGDGEILYQGAETDVGGENALDFDQAIIKSENQTFLSIPLEDVSPGTYEYLRISLSYQNYNIMFRTSGFDLEGTLASFIGFNTYISSYQIDDSLVSVNDDKLQGYWGFESMGTVLTGQAPEGATTVPNPLFDTSPIPQGSCLVTGEFNQALTLTGNENEDVVITVSLSTNQSFEWVEVIEDDKFEPSEGESVVDMGIRGMIPSWE